MGPTHRLAIDLGTCHTVAVVRRGDEAPRALLFDGSPVMASGIYADESGRLSVGRDAERLSQLAPSRFEPYPKRSVDEGAVLLGDTEVTVVEMLAALLKRVADESLQAGVNPVGSTVLTCPADWGGQRRGVLLEAARAANLGPVVLVDEPIAAATYCLRVLGQQVAPLQSLAVFDFGGGTLDVSVVRREFDGLRVLGVGGLDDLGGVDIDAALVGHLGQLINLRNPEIWQRLANPDSTAAHRDRRALWNEVRAAKEMLSRAASAPIHVPGTEEALHLTREELERVAGPLIDRAVDETRRVLERAGVDVRQLAGIFLVGGSSRIPLVASRLHARFGVAPVVPEQPELPVAYGGMLSVATPPQQLFDGGQAPAPRPVSGTPVSPGGFTSFPVSAPIPVSGTPTSSGAYGSPAGLSQTFATQSPSAPASPATAPGAFIPSQTPPPGAGRPGGPPGAPGGPAAFAAAAPPGTRPGPGPGLARPGVPAGIGAPGVGAPGFGGPAFTPPPPPVVVRPRRRTGPWIALIIVLSLIGGCLWGGTKIFGWIGDQFESVKDGFPDNTTAGDNGTVKDPKIQGLKAGAPITLASEGAVAAVAGNGAVYTATVTVGETEVVGYEATGGEKFRVKLPMEPKEVHLTVVGNLLLVDGEEDLKLPEKDNSRGVIDVATGTRKWNGPWADRLDVLYIGTDVIAEVRGFNTSSIERVDLNDGKVRWSHAGDKDGHYMHAERGVRPAQRWPGADGGADVWAPTREPSFNDVVPFRQSLTADPAVAVQLQADDKASTIDLNSGKVKATGTISKGGDSWLVYNDLAIFKLADLDNALVAYNLSDMKQKWQYRATAGTTLDNVSPCGEKLVCVQAELSSGKDAVIAIDTSNGTAKWTKNAPTDGTTSITREGNWAVVGGKLVGGFGPFGGIGDAALLDSNNGNNQFTLGQGLDGHDVAACAAGRVAIITWRNAASAVQVVVVNVADNKIVGAADVAKKDILQKVSMTDNTVVALNPESRVVQRYAIPA
ncbi:Hsp70 family protein [Dactylosporangium aurantiacum]|uniref:Hsp70 family protein n=1 Tax=Dactylosporangium aurantiacum TaxID=35754 RepID=A0A9Q9IHX9_9ACTN|nr:Hsp70 family protein [Dactylosporangium aurantiacum]MDG6109323.1 Hsp70 family protein [Dactylosporangium aurantiacum]UWZ56432.1 Hsp70 family protein [Dactylosporangium aurantiacum]